MTRTTTPTKTRTAADWVRSELASSPRTGPELYAAAKDDRIASRRTIERALAWLADAGELRSELTPDRSKLWRLATGETETVDPQRLQYAMANAVRAGADPRRGVPAGIVQIGTTAHVALSHATGDQLYSRLEFEVAELARWTDLPLVLLPAEEIVASEFDGSFRDAVRAMRSPNAMVAYQHRLSVAPRFRCFDEAVFDQTSSFRAELQAKLGSRGLRLADEGDGATA
jgi:hypothetical protein